MLVPPASVKVTWLPLPMLTVDVGVPLLITSAFGKELQQDEPSVTPTV